MVLRPPSGVHIERRGENRGLAVLETRSSFLRHELIEVASVDDWHSYHAIRRAILFEARGRIGVYREDGADESKSGNHPLLLKFDGRPIGTTRFDVLGEGKGVVRLVAIVQDLQRQGRGRELSNRTEQFARLHGVGTLFVNAARDAVGYYEKMGWTRFSWEPSELRGIADDSVMMRKELTSS